MRYRLRTLMIVLAVGPPVVACIGTQIRKAIGPSGEQADLRLVARWTSARADILSPGPWIDPLAVTDDRAFSMSERHDDIHYQPNDKPPERIETCIGDQRRMQARRAE